MNPVFIELVNQKLSNVRKTQIEKTLALLEEGNTIPFIARYRKEATGSLDEVIIKEIFDAYTNIETLEKRKESVLHSIEEQGELTEALRKQILTADKLQLVEDLYLPYKKKRRTKATIAKEKGLEPLATFLWYFPNDRELEMELPKYLNEKLEVQNVEEILSGVHEILAEEIGENAKIREWLRHFLLKNATILSTVKNEEKDEKRVFQMYYDFSEKVQNIQNHRVLALNRGEKEEIVKVQLASEEEHILQRLHQEFIQNQASSRAAEIIEVAYKDALKRFIRPSVEKEIRQELTSRAEEAAIDVFGENLKNLLMQPSLKGKIVLGFDPAYRTGAKLAIVDAFGKVLDISVIYPVKPAGEAKIQQAKKEFIRLLENYNVEMIAIGNGTASRESEAFVADCLKESKQKSFFVIVNEAGASVYSASPVAREEFPDLTVEKRSAISIARRLQDPLAELVKIDPKSVGVGQYQHDVSQKKLSAQLDFVVETVVNQVGVDVNTASPQLLAHISGLNKTTAKNLQSYREEIGGFTTRTQLKKVPRLGPKAYEQAIGFLRVMDGKNFLDATRIHPESYPLAKQLLESLDIPLHAIKENASKTKLQQASVEKLASQLQVGVITLKDILSDLLAPERDLRDEMPAPILRSDVLKMEDLKTGMKLKGTIRNVVDFGAFVDIGVKQDGLVHLSKMSKRYVKHPKDIVALGDVVDVWVDGIDLEKGRIQLSMVGNNE